MLLFDKYKIVDLDFLYFKEEYKIENYLWDYNISLCPKERFFFIKSFNFQLENGHKIYDKTFEYVCIHPTDIFSIYDFYQSDHFKSKDLNYILSYQEIEKYLELKSKKEILYIDRNKLSFKKQKHFLLFVNEETREREFLIISSNNDKKLEEYINSKKISSFYVKLCVSVKELDYVAKLYKRYLKGKIENKKEIINSLEMISKYIKYFNFPLIDLINKKSQEYNNQKIVNSEKKRLMIQYLNYFQEYENERTMQYELEEDGILFDNVIDDITLFRHSKGYISKLLDQSFLAFKKDLNDVSIGLKEIHKIENDY